MPEFASTRRGFVAGGLALSVAGSAQAQTFPSRPIKWICYQAAGGTMDLTTRAMQMVLSGDKLRSQIEYVLGGDGNIARTELYQSPPDGYLIMTDAAPGASLGQVVTGAAYKATEFEPIFGWSLEGWQICAKKGSQLKTLADLVKLSKERPIIAGSIGRGGASHLQLLLLKQVTKANMNIVHFSGSAQAYPQVIGGNIDIACSGPGSGSHVADSVQFLCVFRDHEPALPDVASARSQGYDIPSIDQVWYAQAPPKTPDNRMKILEGAFSAAYHDPQFVEAQRKAGIVSLQPLSREKMKTIIAEGVTLANKYQADLKAG